MVWVMAAGPVFSIDLVTMPPTGTQSGQIFSAFISADGNYVAFDSNTPQYIDNDTGHYHTYVYDVVGSSFERGSLDENDNPADENTFPRDISDDGRYLLLSSDDALVSTDTNSLTDVYVRDRMTGDTLHASLTHDGMSPNAACLGVGVSNDGRYVIFTSTATNVVSPGTSGSQVFLRDLVGGTTTLVSQSTMGTVANADCLRPAFSKDGRYVVFDSTATNLIDGGGDTNGVADVFIRDLEAMPNPTTTRVSLDSTGSEITGGGSIDGDISRDGSKVVFLCDADGVVPGLDAETGENQIYVRDRDMSTTMHVSVSTSGGASDSSCADVAISPGGRYVVYNSSSTNLLEGAVSGTQVYGYDFDTSVTSRISVAADGTIGSAYSGRAKVSDTGMAVFRSIATNLVPGDTNEDFDVFLAPVDAPVKAAGDPNAALRAKYLKQIKKFKKKLKKAKKKKKTAQVKKFKKKIKIFKKKLRAL